MCATQRSEGFGVSKSWPAGIRLATALLAIFWLAAGAGPAAAGGERKNPALDRLVYSYHLALPSSLPPGMHASLVAYNTGGYQGRLRLQSARSGGEIFETFLAQGASREVELSWIVPGLPVLLECNSPLIEIQLQVKNGLDVLLESFPIQTVAKKKHDFVMPVAGGNSECPGATPGDAAASASLTLVPATVHAGGDYIVTGLDAGGNVVASTEVAAIMGVAVGVELAEEFSGGELEDITAVRVESEYAFSGYGVAAIGSDALGIQPDIHSDWWQTMAPTDWDIVEPISHLVLFNPQGSAVDVTVGEAGMELPALSTTVIEFPGNEVVITAELPITVIEAYAQADGCGVTAQMSCSNNRPWSIPVLLDSANILVASGPRLGY